MTKHENILFVPPLHEDARKFVIANIMNLQCLSYSHSREGIEWIKLPPGSWRFIALHSQMTEEKAREVVEWYGKGDGSINGDGIGDIFTCYDETEFCYDTALESYYSLCRHLGLVGEQAVLKKL